MQAFKTDRGKEENKANHSKGVFAAEDKQFLFIVDDGEMKVVFRKDGLQASTDEWRSFAETVIDMLDAAEGYERNTKQSKYPDSVGTWVF